MAVTQVGMKPESAYYESLHETPLIANTIARKSPGGARVHRFGFLVLSRHMVTVVSAWNQNGRRFLCENGDVRRTVISEPLRKLYEMNKVISDTAEYGCWDLRMGVGIRLFQLQRP